MFVTIEVKAGTAKTPEIPTQKRMQGNLEALEHVIVGRAMPDDIPYLLDIKSLLYAIREQLPK